LQQRQGWYGQQRARKIKDIGWRYRGNGKKKRKKINKAKRAKKIEPSA
jgi:hypothetical protein